MVLSLPVPSKSALRALRRIALGTSCTVAFTTGVLAEDRRRRIHTARQAQENALRIKTSRNYHGGGTSIEAAFNRQSENYELWGDGDISWTAEPERTDEPPVVNPPMQLEYHFPPLRVRNLPLRSPSINVEYELKPRSVANKSDTGLDVVDSIFVRQAQVATSIEDALSQSDKTIESAVAILKAAFADGLNVDTLGELLEAAVVRLATACKRNGWMDTFIPIFQEILGNRPVDEDFFYALQAPAVIVRLLDQSGYVHGTGYHSKADKEKLKEAVTIFCTEFREKPRLLPPAMRDLGFQLCTATYLAELYGLTNIVYWRLSHTGVDFTDLPIGILILANHRAGRHMKALCYFSQLFSQTQPEQRRFYSVVNAAMDSALQLKRFDEAERVIHIATKMSIANNIPTATTWFLKLLGQFWRTTGDLQGTQALFDRLEPLGERCNHPEAIYSAIIQSCVEAGEETQTEQYVDRLRNLTGGELDIRTQGHLALAKAMKHDWKSVEADFTLMKDQVCQSPSVYAAVFTPILQLFTRSHDVPEIESFVRHYIEHLGVIPDQYIFNTMVRVYCEAGEIDSIPKWIQYLQRFGLRIDPVTINIILKNCQNRWGMEFFDLFRLSEKVNSIDSKAIDSATMELLRRSAFAAAKGNPTLVRQLMDKVRSLAPSIVRLDRHDIRKQMMTALEEGQPKKALGTYKYAFNNKISLSSQVVSLAVRASIQCRVGSNLGPTVELLKEARARGLDIHPAMTQFFVHQMDILKEDRQNCQAILKVSIAALEEGGLDLTLPVITKATSMLVDLGRSREAIELWDAHSSRSGVAVESVDIVALSVLLRAYISLSNNTGVQWVMHVLSRNRLFPDKRFADILRLATTKEYRYVEANPNDAHASRRCKLLERSLQQVRAQRAQAIQKREEAEKMALSMIEAAAGMKATERILGAPGNRASQGKPFKRIVLDRKSSVTVSDTWRQLVEVDAG